MLTLSEIKQHLELDENDSSRDQQLNQMRRAALDYMQTRLGRTIPWTDELDVLVEIPASLRSLGLLIVADLFENREASMVGVSIAPNPMYDLLMQPYRIGMGI